MSPTFTVAGESPARITLAVTSGEPLRPTRTIASILRSTAKNAPRSTRRESIARGQTADHDTTTKPSASAAALAPLGVHASGPAFVGIAIASQRATYAGVLGAAAAAAALGAASEPRPSGSLTSLGATLNATSTRAPSIVRSTYLIDV